MSIANGTTITESMRDEWHKARAHRIGASEIAAAIGINRYDSQLRLWLTKTNKLPRKEATDSMEIGSALESAILGLYCRFKRKKIAFTQVFYVSNKHDYLCATLDAINSDGVNVQVKNVGCASAPLWGDGGSDEIPHEVIMQVQQEMLCSDLKMTDVVALIGGSDLRVYPVHRNEKIINHIIKMGGQFIERVRSNVYPSPDPDRDNDLIRYLFQDCVGETTFTEKQTEDVLSWEKAGNDIKLLEKKRDQLKALMLLAMGDASQATLTDGRVLKRTIVNVGASLRDVKAYSFPKLTIGFAEKKA